MWGQRKPHSDACAVCCWYRRALSWPVSAQGTCGVALPQVGGVESAKGQSRCPPGGHCRLLLIEGTSSLCGQMWFREHHSLRRLLSWVSSPVQVQRGQRKWGNTRSQTWEGGSASPKVGLSPPPLNSREETGCGKEENRGVSCFWTSRVLGSSSGHRGGVALGKQISRSRFPVCLPEWQRGDRDPPPWGTHRALVRLLPRKLHHPSLT